MRSIQLHYHKSIAFFTFWNHYFIISAHAPVKPCHASSLLKLFAPLELIQKKMQQTIFIVLGPSHVKTTDINHPKNGKRKRKNFKPL